MAEVRWIQTSLFLMPVLLFTAAVTGQSVLRVVVRVGDEVTLPCKNVIGNQDNCERTWLFSAPRSRETLVLIKRGQISERANPKSDRLNVTQNCSLVIKKVTDEDVGQYTCRQYAPMYRDSLVSLSVVTMTERKNNDQVTLFCSVLVLDYCNHRVEWLSEGKDKDKQTSQPRCSDHFTYKKTESKKYKSFNCELTDFSNGQVQRFPFSPQTSGEKPGETTTTATTTTTTTTAENNVTPPPRSKIEVWWFIIVAVGLVALLVIVVTVFLCKRSKGRKTQMDSNMGQRLNPVVPEAGPEITQDTDDPEDGVAYASISYTKKANSKTRVQVRSDDDEGETVTYSTVRACSSPAAAASADPNNLYAAVNKPHK